MDSQRDITLPWRGSANQRVIDTKRSLQKGEVVLWKSIKLPTRATVGSAGYDFAIPIDFMLRPGETIKISTGIICKLDEGWVLKLYPRSGHGFKYRLQLNNTGGIRNGGFGSTSR